MTRYLLDTNVILDFLKGQPAVLKAFARHAPRDLAISSISVMEIEYSLSGQPSARARYGELWTAMQADLVLLPYDRADARATASLRQHLKTLGTPIGPYDLQLAGTALARGLTVVTNNTAEFSRAPGLNCQDWRAGEKNAD